MEDASKKVYEELELKVTMSKLRWLAFGILLNEWQNVKHCASSLGFSHFTQEQFCYRTQIYG